MTPESEILEHMRVVGADGKLVGRVDHVEGSEIEFNPLDLGDGPKTYRIPLNWVDHVSHDFVWLTLTERAVTAAWREHE